ncbi:MAG: hypothetical protein JNJ52_09310 [Flavobacterium sp.]|nr:hypothetical protein [Flavobacterium sp.]
MKYLIIVFFSAIGISYAQSESLINQTQYGATLKAKMEFSPNSKNEPLLNFRVSSCLGIASRWMADELYPSVNAELQLYNGGLGSRTLPDNRYFTFDGIVAFTLTAGHLHDNFGTAMASINRNIPLRYFADFAIPSLQNPYNYSISLGTNLVFTTDGGRRSQRLGFLNLNHSGLQLSYYNDGTPFQHFFLGDGKDRYYTGGGVLSYNNGYGNYDQFRSYSFEASYHKFSGYNQNSFELSNSINASNVDYKNTDQRYYNKSLWKFNVQSNNTYNGFGLAASAYNSVRFDGQHLIHWLINNSFHIVPYNYSIVIEPSYYITSSSNFK